MISSVDHCRGPLTLVVAIIVCAVAGCGPSPQRQARADRIDNPIRGLSVNERVGELRLIKIRLGGTPQDQDRWEKGTDLPLFLTIANDGSTDDTLVAVTSVDAATVAEREGDVTHEAPINIPVPGHDVASLQYPGGLHLVLRDLKRDVPKGAKVPVTMRFAKNGVTTMKVPVQRGPGEILSPLNPSTRTTPSS